MVEGINSVYSRIRDIYDRISEIQRSAGSIYSINSTQKLYNSDLNNSNPNQGAKSQKTFEEILKEAMLENSTNLEEGKGKNVNLLLKPEESIKEILLSNNEKSVDLNLKNKSMEDSYDDIIKEASSK
ncbi:MAG: hypothetical protein ACPL4C_01490, partial [Brevinematia bacterium]